MTKILILNLKMNLTYEEASTYANTIKGKINDYKVIICPSSLYLETLKNSGYPLGSQNVFYLDKGAYTGEISPLQLRTTGIDYAIIGHSERRCYFHEDNNLIAQKITACLKNNIKPILCIGETIEERNAKKTNDVLKEQLLTSLQNVSYEDLNNIIIAYEPVWAIGSGKTPTIKEIEDAITYIKNLINDIYKTNINVLYGGSVNKENIKNIMNISVVDGALIGTSSIDVNYLIDMVKSINV